MPVPQYSSPRSIQIANLRSLPSVQVSIRHQFASVVIRSPPSPAIVTGVARTSMRDEMRLRTTRFLKLPKWPSPGSSNRVFETLPSSQFRRLHIITPQGAHLSTKDNDIRPPTEVLKSLIWNLALHFTIGVVCSWQLMKHHPKLHPAVWVLGRREDVCERRLGQKSQKPEAQIEKMTLCSVKALARIVESALPRGCTKATRSQWYGVGPDMSSTGVRRC
jgi:hypothetical protein